MVRARPLPRQPGLTADSADLGREPFGDVERSASAPRNRCGICRRSSLVAPAPEELESLLAVAAAAERLQVRRVERGSSPGDLHDVVDFQLRPSVPAVAGPAGEPVAVERVRPRGVPEIFALEPPLAHSRTVWGASGGQRSATAHASTGQSGGSFQPRSLGKPAGRVPEGARRSGGEPAGHAPNFGVEMKNVRLDRRERKYPVSLAPGRGAVRRPTSSRSRSCWASTPRSSSAS